MNFSKTINENFEKKENENIEKNITYKDICTKLIPDKFKIKTILFTRLDLDVKNIIKI